MAPCNLYKGPDAALVKLLGATGLRTSFSTNQPTASFLFCRCHGPPPPMYHPLFEATLQHQESTKDVRTLTSCRWALPQSRDPRAQLCRASPPRDTSQVTSAPSWHRVPPGPGFGVHWPAISASGLGAYALWGPGPVLGAPRQGRSESCSHSPHPAGLSDLPALGRRTGATKKPRQA